MGQSQTQAQKLPQFIQQKYIPTKYKTVYKNKYNHSFMYLHSYQNLHPIKPQIIKYYQNRIQITHPQHLIQLFYVTANRQTNISTFACALQLPFNKHNTNNNHHITFFHQFHYSRLQSQIINRLNTPFSQKQIWSVILSSIIGAYTLVKNGFKQPILSPKAIMISQQGYVKVGQWEYVNQQQNFQQGQILLNWQKGKDSILLNYYWAPQGPAIMEQTISIIPNGIKTHRKRQKNSQIFCLGMTVLQMILRKPLYQLETISEKQIQNYFDLALKKRIQEKCQLSKKLSQILRKMLEWDYSIRIKYQQLFQTFANIFQDKKQGLIDSVHLKQAKSMKSLKQHKSKKQLINQNSENNENNKNNENNDKNMISKNESNEQKRLQYNSSNFTNLSNRVGVTMCVDFGQSQMSINQGDDSHPNENQDYFDQKEQQNIQKLNKYNSYEIKIIDESQQQYLHEIDKINKQESKFQQKQQKFQFNNTNKISKQLLNLSAIQQVKQGISTTIKAQFKNYGAYQNPYFSQYEQRQENKYKQYQKQQFQCSHFNKYNNSKIIYPKQRDQQDNIDLSNNNYLLQSMQFGNINIIQSQIDVQNPDKFQVQQQQEQKGKHKMSHCSSQISFKQNNIFQIHVSNNNLNHNYDNIQSFKIKQKQNDFKRQYNNNDLSSFKINNSNYQNKYQYQYSKQNIKNNINSFKNITQNNNQIFTDTKILDIIRNNKNQQQIIFNNNPNYLNSYNVTSTNNTNSYSKNYYQNQTPLIQNKWYLQTSKTKHPQIKIQEQQQQQQINYPQKYLTKSNTNHNNNNNNNDNTIYRQSFAKGYYQGQKSQNMRNGFGTFFYSQGGKYIGHWTHNKMNGRGTLYYPNNKIAYEGMWRDDQLHGNGKLYNENPIIIQQNNGFFNYKCFDQCQDYWVSYEGQFKNDDKDGKGELLLSNGQKFVGNFKNDLVDGSGIFYRKDGSKVVGYWNENKMVSGSIVDTRLDKWHNRQ